MSTEHNTQPFRQRNWLFAQDGVPEESDRVRRGIRLTLPEVLLRQVSGELPGEAAFSWFLHELKEQELWRSDSLLSARVLGKTARHFEKVAREAGARRPGNTFLVTDDHLMAVARSGDQPLYYALLKGTATCERCQPGGQRLRSEASLHEHLHRRTVAIASHVRDSAGWIELPKNHSLAIDRALNVEVIEI